MNNNKKNALLVLIGAVLSAVIQFFAGSGSDEAPEAPEAPAAVGADAVALPDAASNTNN